jgi:hypothetical protein
MNALILISVPHGFTEDDCSCSDSDLVVSLQDTDKVEEQSGQQLGWTPQPIGHEQAIVLGGPPTLS